MILINVVSHWQTEQFLKKACLNWKKALFCFKKSWRGKRKVIKYYQTLLLMLIQLPLRSSVHRILKALWCTGNSHVFSYRGSQTGLFLLLTLPRIFRNGCCLMLVWGLLTADQTGRVVRLLQGTWDPGDHGQVDWWGLPTQAGPFALGLLV